MTQKRILILIIFIALLLISLFLILFGSKKKGERPNSIRTEITITPTTKLGLPQEYKPKFIDQANYTYNRQKNMPFRCSASVEIIDQIMMNFPKSNLVFVDNAIHMDERLKLATGEPFIRLPVEESFRIEIAEKTAQNTALYIKLDSLIKKLGNNIGFSPDPLNLPDDNDIYHGLQYTISAENVFFVIRPGNNDLIVNCIEISPEEAMAIDVVREISKINNYSSNHTLSLWEYSDNLAMLDVSTGAGGVGNYWGKINGRWKLLFSTQSTPWCDEIEAYRIGRGVRCARKGEPYTSDANRVRY